MGGVEFGAEESAEEQSTEVERPAFAPTRVDPTADYQTADVQAAVGGDGMPVIGGEPPAGAEPGVTDDNMVCASGPGRARCEHFITVLMSADGIAKGFNPLRRVRRFCKALSTATEPWEISGEYYACSARQPRDEKSIRLIEEFEAEQKKQTKEAAEESGSAEF